VRVCTRVKHGMLPEGNRDNKKGNEDKVIAQRAGIKESVGNIRPVWPLQMLGWCWVMERRSQKKNRKKRRGEKGNEPEMQYGKSKESTGGRKGDGGCRRRGRHELF
jgi:hypothetical protein